MKIGIGYDVHRLVSGRKLILGGVNISYEYGLLGHSDADVLIHAIMDALLGAAKAGDIGVLFPDTEAKYKDISSIELLKCVKEVVRDKGYRIVNIDSVIIAQKPKLRPYVEEMEQNLSIALGLPAECINIKATTEEGLGFTGELLGISSQAVCLIDEI